MLKSQDAKLEHLLPSSVKHDKNVRAVASAIDVELRKLSEAVDVPTIFARIDELDDDQLLHLAVSTDVTPWRETWPIGFKRDVIKTAIRTKAKKGTLFAIREATKSIASAVKITEWWQESPKGKPHTFKVEALLNHIDGLLEAEQQDDLIALIDEAKPVRSHYTFTIIRARTERLGFMGTFRPLVYACIRPVPVGRASAEGRVVLGGAVGRPVTMRTVVTNLKGKA